MKKFVPRRGTPQGNAQNETPDDVNHGPDGRDYSVSTAVRHTEIGFLKRHTEDEITDSGGYPPPRPEGGGGGGKSVRALPNAREACRPDRCAHFRPRPGRK